jgi:ABC-type dipeptide/oligopeptide/nickel transport system permease subunit
MQTAVVPEASVWLLTQGWFLLGGALLIIAASLSLRQWGGTLIRAYRPQRITLGTADELVPPTGSLRRFIPGAVRIFSNAPLLAGLVITGFLLVAFVAPGVLAPYGPEETGKTLQVIRGKIMARPFPPSPPYPMGTDLRGRDLLSRILFGARRTLTICLAVAALRLAIGIVLGGISGWKGGVIAQQILSLGTVSASIPSLLFAFVFILAIGPTHGFGVFLLGLGLTGWAELTNTINAAVRWVRGQRYMEGALAIGATPAHIARRHLLPNIMPQLLPAVALEISAVLLTLGELGFLGIFIGERFFGYVPQTIRTLTDTEWAGMLAGTRLSLFEWPWLPLSPALAFLVTILGLNLLAMGLRTYLDPMQSRLRN